MGADRADGQGRVVSVFTRGPIGLSLMVFFFLRKYLLPVSSCCRFLKCTPAYIFTPQLQLREEIGNVKTAF